MKSIGTIILKGLLVIVLLTGSSLLLSTNGVQTVSEARAVVKEYQVYEYLVNLGYEVLQLSPMEESEDWQAITILNGQMYSTIVHVCGTRIIDHEDSSI